MIETLAREWKDESGIIELVKNDQNTLKKKVKAFLKNLFKPVDSNESDSEGRFDSQQVLLKLADLSECIESIGHRKVCKPFILCILDLFIGHSRIREFLLEKRDGFVRRKLVELFCLLCSSQLDAAKEQENLIDLILGAYDATFSVEDQSLLRLLSLLELHGVSLQRYQPFIWGINGAMFYASKHSQKLAFLKMPSIDEIFKGFEGKRLANSLAAFPIHIQMSEKEVDICTLPDLVASNLYDPRFILPMFYHLLSAQSITKCHKFISYGGLSYTIAALSSHCMQIRAISYKILSHLYYNLECASYPQDRQLWIGLIDYIRSGLTESNQKLDSVHTVLIARLIEILLNPVSAMYSSVRQYLITQQLKPYNYKSLSSFYRICIHLVSTSDAQVYSIYQKFAIHWITDSLRTANDVRLCSYKNVFKDMLLLYNSPLCAPDNQPLIMKLITRLAQLYEGVKVLCFDCAIFSWIKHLLITVPNIDISEETNKNLLYNLVVVIWETVYSKFFLLPTVNDFSNSKPFIFYESFGYELLDTLSRIVYKTSDKSRIDKYVEICGHILSHNENELNNYNTKLTICSNLPVNLESMFEQIQLAN